MNAGRLFLASRVALVVTAMSFALRGDAAGAWGVQFHLSHEEIGWINGTAFWGFSLAMLLGGPLCDAVGLGRIVAVAFFAHLAGILLTVFAWNYSSLFAGTLLFGIANGAVEAACNPLIATLYPADKTTKLNQFHVWFPGGIVLGGLIAFGLSKFGLGWQVSFALLLVPWAMYGALFWRQFFPPTERVVQGISTKEMILSCLRPGFLLLLACMLLTAATELGPGQWIPNILNHAGVSGILVLVWITGLMAVGRQFAGPLVHRLSPLGLLLLSAVLSTAGLWVMSRTTGPTLFASATLFAFGVCFFWPTMLGYVSETFPRTGALGLALMGGAGMFSVSLVLPVIGRWYDEGIIAGLPRGFTPESMAATGDPAWWAQIQASAGLATLGKVACLPVILTAVFFLLLLQRRQTPSP